MLLKILRAPFYFLALVVIFLEELLWEPLARAAAWVGDRLRLQRLEAAIASLPPRWALCAFLIPTVVLFPFKIIALAAFARGFFLLGLVIAFFAKIVGTALVARIFTLCRPQLLSVPWFARAYAFVTRLREGALLWLRATAAWRAATAARKAIGQLLAQR